MCRMSRHGISGHTWPRNQSSPVSHDGALHNAQYHAPESDDISNVHVSGNEKE